MRRFHSQKEQNLMLRRWRQELANHDWEYGQDYPYCYLAPPGDAEGTDCHCSRGKGTQRKNRPYGCNRPRCGLCHPRYYIDKARHNKKRAAIEFDITAGS